MLSVFSLTFAALAVAAAIGGAVYGLVAGNDQGGSALLFAAGAIASALSIAGFVAAGPDTPAEMRSRPAPRPVASAAQARPNQWPAFAALATGLLAVGFATEPTFAWLGAIAVVATAFGWLGAVWSEHPTWNARLADRFYTRVVAPVGLPGAILVIAGIGVICVSRLLLAVSVGAAPIIVFGAACVALAGFALVATRPIGSTGVLALVAAGVLFVAGSGIVGAVVGEREFHHKGGEEHADEPAGEDVQPDDDDQTSDDEDAEAGSGPEAESDISGATEDGDGS